MQYIQYTSTKPRLIIPEYGRHIQMLVEQAIVIENRDERNKFVGGIIDLMGEMYPYLRDVNDFKHKLWTHLALMSDFKLDIDSPYEKPIKEVIFEHPAPLPYPQTKFKYRHYGKIIISVIEYIAKLEESDEKKALTLAVANQMKKQYLAWNKDIVEDSVILGDLRTISNNTLQLPDDLVLAAIKDLKPRNFSKQKVHSSKKKSNKGHKGKISNKRG